jgi:hypothetical protein
MFKISHRPMGKLLKCSPRLTLAHNCGRRSGQLQVVRAAGTFNISHRPDGKLLTRLPRPTLARLQTHFGQLQWVRAAETLNTSHLVLVLKNSRWEFLLTCPIDSHLSIGIFYQSGVRASHACKTPSPRLEKCRRACLDSRHNCGRRFGQLQDVRAAAEIFPSPRWEIVDVLAPTLALTTAADNPVNNRGYIPQRPANFPSPRWETHV